MMSPLLFRLNFTGFVVCRKREKDIHISMPWGAFMRTAQSHTVRIFFPHGLGFLFPWSLHILRRAKPQHYSLLGSDISCSHCFQRNQWSHIKLKLKDQWVVAPFFLFCCLFTITKNRKLSKRLQCNCWWFTKPHNVRRRQLLQPHLVFMNHYFDLMLWKNYNNQLLLVSQREIGEYWGGENGKDSGAACYHG